MLGAAAMDNFMSAWRQFSRVMLIPLTLATLFVIGQVAYDRGKCGPVDVSESSALTSEDVHDLLSRGYFGSPTDNREALYAPGCEQKLIDQGILVMNYNGEGN